MTNADKFKNIFGLYATELWSMPEKDFLKWLNSEAMNCSENPNNSDCISRQAAIDATWFEPSYTDPLNVLTEVRDRLKALPSAELERRKGKWILDEDPHDGDCRCSACLIAIDQMHERNHGLLNALTGGKWWTFYNYCPNCGADMRGEQE